MAQGELQTQVQELDRAKKSYYEEEHVAHDVREKANAAEEKWVKGVEKGGRKGKGSV